jgi:hypothetical protein
MSGKNVDNSLLKLHGIETDEDEKGEFKMATKKCERCGEVNPFTNKICKCGMILDKKTMIEIVQKDMQRTKADEVMDKLMQIPEFKEMFLSKIKEVIVP